MGRSRSRSVSRSRSPARRDSRSRSPRRNSAAPNAKLFIANLSFDITEDDLRKEFDRYGEVTDVMISMNRETNRPRGFGFVTFANVEDAEKAVRGQNDKEVLGRPMKVEFSKPQSDRPRDGGFRGGRGGGRGGFGDRRGGRGGFGDRRGGRGGGFRGGRGGGRDRDFGRDRY